jgi:hypothetical protein
MWVNIASSFPSSFTVEIPFQKIVLFIDARTDKGTLPVNCNFFRLLINGAQQEVQPFLYNRLPLLPVKPIIIQIDYDNKLQTVVMHPVCFYHNEICFSLHSAGI